MDMNKNPSPARSIFLVALLVVCFGLATSLRAQLVTVTYSIAPPTDSFDSPTVNPTLNLQATLNLSATVLSATGVAPLNPDIPGGVKGHFLFTGWETSETVNNANKYYSFTITPNVGMQISYTSVTYSLAAFGTDKWELRSSKDGFTGNFGAHTIPLDASQNPFTDDVSSIGTQAGAITFRLYGYSDPGGSADGLANNNGFFGPPGSGRDLVITGTVSAVPEPHQYAIIAGVGLLSFAAYRRRTRLSKLA